MSEGRCRDWQRTWQRTWRTEILIQTRDCKQIRRIKIVLCTCVWQDTVKMVLNSGNVRWYWLNLSGLGWEQMAGCFWRGNENSCLMGRWVAGGEGRRGLFAGWVNISFSRMTVLRTVSCVKVKYFCFIWRCVAGLQSFKHSHRKLIFGTVSTYNFRNEANILPHSSGFIWNGGIS